VTAENMSADDMTPPKAARRDKRRTKSHLCDFAAGRIYFARGFQSTGGPNRHEPIGREADVLYGVAMQEQGISRMLTINLNDVEKKLNIR